MAVIFVTGQDDHTDKEERASVKLIREGKGKIEMPTAIQVSSETGAISQAGSPTVFLDILDKRIGYSELDEKSLEQSSREQISEAASELAKVIRECLTEAITIVEPLSIATSSEEHTPLDLSVLSKPLSHLQGLVDSVIMEVAGGVNEADEILELHEELSRIVPKIAKGIASGTPNQSQLRGLSLSLFEMKLGLDAFTTEYYGNRALQKIQQEFLNYAKEQGGKEKLVSMLPGSALHSEMMRRDELNQEVFPAVQKSVGSAVQQLIAFSGILRDRAPSPVGITFVSAYETLDVSPIVEKLKQVGDEVNQIVTELSRDMVSEVEYYSFLSVFVHQCDTLRVLLARQNVGGSVNESDIPLVQHQIDAAIRSLTKQLRGFQEMSTAPFRVPLPSEEVSAGSF